MTAKPARKTRKPAAKKANPTPEKSLDEMQREMGLALEQSRVEYVEEYKALCRKHRFEMVPEMVLRAGQAPTVTMYPTPLK